MYTWRENESLGPLPRGGICGSLRFGEPVGVAVAERDNPGPIAPIDPGFPWWCNEDVPICDDRAPGLFSINKI